MKIATIARDKAHSPQMAESDNAILSSIEQELAAMGHSVTRIDEMDDFGEYDAICHMSRSESTLQKLKESEANGCRVINSPTAVENCSRTRLMNIMQDADILQPAYTLLKAGEIPPKEEYPGWIKKGNGWSQKKEDVAFVTNEKEAANAISAIDGQAIFCKHIEGDVIKFYGVKGGFFAHSYPDPEKTKFGLEKINGAPKRHSFNPQELKERVFAAAEAARLDIFGGDCIITANGDIYIIDLNDFPSFSPVRAEAAKEIAKFIVKEEKI